MQAIESKKVPKTHPIDLWLSKYPGSQRMKVFVTFSVLIFGTGFLYFGGGRTKGGHGKFDTERPEAVFKALDEADKQRIAKGVPALPKE